MRSSELDRRTGARVLLKAECLQRTGSFKFRGASVAAARAHAAGVQHLVACSSGNHAAALARAGTLLGQAVTVFMPLDAPDSKVAAAQALGARLRRYDRYKDDRGGLASAFADEAGALLVPSADDESVIAGQATAVAELLADHPHLDAVVVPVGGGGLLAGALCAVEAAGSRAAVIGVEPDGSDDFARSVASGRRETVALAPTIADGLQLAHIGALPWQIAVGRVHTTAVVDDDAIRGAMALLAERVKLVVEPSGAAPVAALLSHALDLRGARVGVVLSGGNVSAARFARLIG